MRRTSSKKAHAGAVSFDFGQLPLCHRFRYCSYHSFFSTVIRHHVDWGVCVCESNHRGANVSWHANAIPAPEGHARRATKITIRFPLPYLFRYACLTNSYICQCNGHTWARFCGTEKRHKSDDDSFALLSSQFLGILSWCNRRPSRMMHYPNKNTPFAPRRAKKNRNRKHMPHTHTHTNVYGCVRRS